MNQNEIDQTSILGFVARTTVLHIVTYFFFGLIFAFFNPFHQGVHTIELFPEYAFLFRSMESNWVIAGAALQVFRGPFLMAPLYYFRSTFLGEERGWTKLCGVLVCLTLLGSVTAGPGSIEGMFYTNLPMKLHLDGYPEVITQILAFSYLVPYLEKRKENKKLVYGLTAVCVIIVALLSYAVYLNQ